MRIATIVCLIGLAGALGGCGRGGNVEFVASNPASVLLDFDARPSGQLVTANEIATQQCQIFSRRTAVLESLNVRNEGVIRATYLCRDGTQTAFDTQARSTNLLRQ